MTRIEEILGKNINSVKELRDEIKRLQDSIAKIDPTEQEFVDTSYKLIAAQEQLTSVTRANKDAIVAADDSIVGMERSYKALYNTYKMMTEEERNSPFGKETQKQLKDLSENLNNIKKDVGNYKDNIGRYAESVMSAFEQMGGSVGGLVGPFKTATQGITAFNQALKANPVMAVIGLVMTLINVIKQLVASVKNNEESQMRLNEAMASFQPIIDAAKNAMDRMGQAIVKVIEFIGKVVDKTRLAIATFTDFIGITKGAKDAVKEQQKTYKDLAKSVNDLTLKKRELQKTNAEDKAEVERLREEASSTTDLVEKKALLQQAKDKQAEIDNRNIEIAREELRILETQSTLTANDAATNEQLAAAVAKVSEAEATAAHNAKEFNEQLKSTEKSAGGATTAVKNYREEAKKIYEETIENSKTELTKLTEKYEQEKKLLEKYHFDTTLLTKQYYAKRNSIIEEASKEAASKATNIYADIMKKYENEEKQSLAQVSDFFNTEIDQMISDITKATEKSNTFNNFVKDYFGIDKNMPEWQAMAKDLVDGINEALGIDIKFPPDLDKGSIKEFEDNINLVAAAYVNAVNRMKAAADKKKFENELGGILQNIFEGQVEAADYYDASENNQYLEYMAETNRIALEWQADYYKKIAELNDLSNEERLEAWQNYYDAVNQMREAELAAIQLSEERKTAVMQETIGLMGDIHSSINSVANAYSSLIDSEVKLGKITEDEAKKKKKALIAMEKVALAVNVAQIAASTAAGIMDVWKGWGAEIAGNAQTAAAAGPGFAAAKAALDAKSTAAAVLRTAAIGTAGAANIAAATMGSIAKINNMKAELEGADGGGSGSVGVAANVAEIDSTPYSYTRTFQTADEEDKIYNKEYFVSVVDINDVQNRVKVREDESTF